MTTGLVACLLFLSAGSMASSAPAQPWRILSKKEGVQLESRRVSGERFEQLRVETSADVAPVAMADYLFGKYLEEKNKNIARTFVQREPKLTIWSDVLRTPMISARCYSMRFKRVDGANGVIRVKFESMEYVGTTPVPGCIALRSRGEWILTPSGKGTHLRYVSLTDIGGKVPVSFARRTLSSAAVLSVRKVVAGSSGLPLPRGVGD